MALKFGQIFQDLGAGFQSAIKGGQKLNADVLGALKTNFNNLSNLRQEIKRLEGEADKAATNIRNYKKTIGDLQQQQLSASPAQAAAIQSQIDATKALIDQEEALATLLDTDMKIALEAVTEAEEEYSDALDKNKGKVKSISQINEDYSKSIDDLNKKIGDGIMSHEEWKDALAELNKNMAKQVALSTAASAMKASNPFDSLTDGLDTGMNMLAESLAAEFGPIAGIIVEGVKLAGQQINELNKSLIELTRSTGGLVTAAKLGFDSFGNAANGVKSLKAAVIDANVSVEEFNQAMNSLFSDGFGQTIGVTQDLANSQKDLQKYGIEASRQMKMFSADIGPAIRGLVQDWGSSIGDATKMMKEGADQARAMGLSVKEFAKNMADVTSLVGEVYFATREEMTKMANIATKLGTSVATISKGIIEMNGITGLFQKQQQAAALGLRGVARNLSQIYALRAQGRGAEAAQLELASFAKDLQRQGMIGEGGNITQQGIATMEASGASKEQIAALNRMAKIADKTGIALSKIGDPKLLTAEEKIRLEREEKANRTMEEQFNQMFGSFKQSLIDPLAKLITPIVKFALNVLEPIFGIITNAINLLMGALSPVIAIFDEVFNQVGGIITDIFDPIKEMGAKINKTLEPVFAAFSSIGRFIVKALGVPFRFLSSLIGGLVTVLGGVVEFIGNIIGPIFSAVGTAFDDMSKWIDNAIDWFQGLFKGLADAIGGVMEPFKMLWDALGKFYDWIAKFLGFNETAAETTITNKDWADILGAKEGVVPESPSARQQVGEQIKAQSTALLATREAQDEAKVASTFGSKVPPMKTNVTVNTSGIFDNKQQVQSSVSGK